MSEKKIRHYIINYGSNRGVVWRGIFEVDAPNKIEAINALIHYCAKYGRSYYRIESIEEKEI